jgi:2'-5' RNA ligase
MAETYALVAYLPGELGRFVDALRKRLEPGFTTWRAHVTILPPRTLPAPEEKMLTVLREKCPLIEPFDTKVGGVTTFWPVKGVVYLPISIGFQKLAALHDMLNVSELAYPEVFPYVPHVTVAQNLDEAATQEALAEVSSAQSRYRGPAYFRVDSLCLVRQASPEHWENVAAVPLGTAPLVARK